MTIKYNSIYLVILHEGYRWGLRPPARIWGLTTGRNKSIYLVISHTQGVVMLKSKALLIKVEPEFLERVNAKVTETGVPYAVVVRRAVEHWLATGDLSPAQSPITTPASRKATGGKRSAAKRKA